MSNADVENVKHVAEQLSKRLEDPTATRGKLVDEMFVSATTYLEDYARRTGDDRPLKAWTSYQERWRKNVTDAISMSQKMTGVYRRFDNLLKEVKDVATKEEMDHAIALLKLLLDATPPELPLDPANHFRDLARDVSYFISTSGFPELNLHGEFINDSLLQFTNTWLELRVESFKFRDLSEQATLAPLPVVFRRFIKLAMEAVVPLIDGLDRYIASLNLA